MVYNEKIPFDSVELQHTFETAEIEKIMGGAIKRAVGKILEFITFLVFDGPLACLTILIGLSVFIMASIWKHKILLGFLGVVGLIIWASVKVITTL